MRTPRRRGIIAAAGVLLASTLGTYTTTPANAAAPRCHGERATIVGTSGDDRIRGTARRDVIVARGGDDRIRGRGGDDLICGNNGADRLAGGSGDDRLEGGASRISCDGGCQFEMFDPDVLIGGPGDDVFRGQPRGHRQLRARFGGPADIISFADAGRGIRVDLRSGIARGQGRDRILTPRPRTNHYQIVGSRHDDKLVGNRHPNVLVGRGGSDRVEGGGERDLLFAHHADREPRTPDPRRNTRDVLLGGPTADLLYDGPGDDLLRGEGGSDHLHLSNRGHDTGLGGRGHDRIVTLRGDKLVGGQGKDRLLGGPKSVLRAGMHDDRVDLDPTRKLPAELRGGPGWNTLNIDLRRDGTSPIRLETDLAAGVVRVDGREADLEKVGHVRLISNYEGETQDVWTATGDDAGNAFTVRDLPANESDQLTATVTAGGGDDRVVTSSGDDTVAGGSGDDLLFGGDGQDSVDGGAGNDVCEEFETASSCERTAPDCDRLKPTIGGTANDDALVGTPGPDVISGGPGDDTINGGGGDDVICGHEGSDTLAGGDGLDRLYAGDSTGYGAETMDVDRLDGGADRDFMLDGPGRDTLQGGDGEDLLLYRQGGSDRLDGGPGDDHIEVERPRKATIVVALQGGLGHDTGEFDLYGHPDNELYTNLATGEGTLGGSHLSLALDSLEALIATGLDNVHWTAIGTDRAEVFAGGSQLPATIDARGGNDILNTGGSDDDLDGGPGEDRANAGGGNDTCTAIETVRSCETISP